jgi:hypothetical protein
MGTDTNCELAGICFKDLLFAKLSNRQRVAKYHDTVLIALVDKRVIQAGPCCSARRSPLWRVQRHVAAFRLADMSASFKAQSSLRTPKARRATLIMAVRQPSDFAMVGHFHGFFTRI